MKRIKKTKIIAISPKRKAKERVRKLFSEIKIPRAPPKAAPE